MACSFLQALLFMGNTVQIDITVASAEQGEIIIAELSEINFHAFEQNNNLLSLFIKEEYFDEDIFKDTLSILASKSGADKITAVDNDEWSIENAKENFFNNSCNNIRLLKAESINDLGTFDIILANINLNAITANIKSLKKASHSSTKLLLSGILNQEDEEFKKNFFEKRIYLRNDKRKKMVDLLKLHLLRKFSDNNKLTQRV